MEQKRLVLWVLFFGSLFLLMMNWTQHQAQLAQREQPGASSPSVSGGVPAAASSLAQISGAASTAAGAAVLPGQAATPTQASQASVPSNEQQWTLHNDLVRVSVSSTGGDVVRVELLHYPDEQDAKRPARVLDRQEFQYVAQTGLVGGSFPNHLSQFHLQDGMSPQPDSLTLESETQGGLRLIKHFRLRPDDYRLEIDHEVVNVGGAPVQAQLYTQLTRSNKKTASANFAYSTYLGAAFYTQEHKYQKLSFDDILKGVQPKERTASDGWVAMVQQYFVSTWLLPPAQREYFAHALPGAISAVGGLMALPQVEAGSSVRVDATLYSGPIDERKLEDIATGLGATKDYGIFTILAKPLFWVLAFFHDWLKNWGWAIVALTVSIKLLFFPLTAASYRSMARMKAIAPRLTELREKYRDEPQQMNAEMMRIYREEKINPLGGCLPILIQIPVFIALYNVLLLSVEMRNQPWVGWIHDLAVRDPYYILPVLMTLTTVLQIKLNPTPPDPMQARLMWIMPLAFSVTFFLFPSGMVIYWLTNNLLSIAQQWAINRKLKV